MALGGLVLTMAACSDSGPDVTHDGQIAYACALAEHIAEGDTDMTNWTFIGDDASPEVRATMSLGALTGGAAGFTLEGHDELSEAGRNITQAVSTIDPEVLREGLDGVSAACEDLDVSAEGDVSEEGQIAYACDLATHVVEEHGQADSWGGLGEEHAWHETITVGSLFGGGLNQALPDHPDLSDAGQQVVRSVSTLNTEELDAALDEIVSGCEEL